MGGNIMYKVTMCNFDDFTEKEQEEYCFSDNGCGKEYATYIVEKVDNEIIAVNSDAMEPEDASFGRDLNWIAEALKSAYKLGKNDSKPKKLNSKEDRIIGQSWGVNYDL